MKKILVFLAFFLCFQSVQAACVDLPSNLSKGKESSDVLLLQNFLKEKGYLKATPNGYYGLGTHNAVKLYQNSKSLARSGQVFPLTRAAIKADSCVVGKATTTTSTSISTSSPKTAATSTPQVALSEAEKVILKKKEDMTLILKAMYSYNQDTKKYLVPITSSSTEICAPTATSSCESFIDLSVLIPNFISKIPIASNKKTQGGAGYYLNRNENNGFTISSLESSGEPKISLICYFGDSCKITEVAAVSTKIPPTISSIERIALVVGGKNSKKFTIHGQGFSTSSNVIIFTPKMSQKSYTVTTNAPSLDGKTISIDSSFTNETVSCGIDCKERLPSGSYGVMVKTSFGESNRHYLDVTSVTANSVSSRPNTSITPNSANVELATITLGTNFLIRLKSLSVTSTGAPKAVAKFSKYSLKDITSGTTTLLSGPTFTFPKEDMLENQSKIYALYADVGNVLSDEAGTITFSETFTVNDYISGDDIQIPVKDFMVTVSY